MRAYYENANNRQVLIGTARQWVGTPFRPHSRVKGCGVDCVQLAAALYLATGAIDEFNEGNYPMDGGHHLSKSRVDSWLEESGRFESVSVKDIWCGDLMVFEIGRLGYHVGVHLEGDSFIQSVHRLGTNIFPLRDPTWLSRLREVWRPIEL